jgi:hypothetical protein
MSSAYLLRHLKFVEPESCAISITPLSAPHRFFQMNYSRDLALWLWLAVAVAVAVVEIFRRRLFQDMRLAISQALSEKMNH